MILFEYVILYLILHIIKLFILFKEFSDDDYHHLVEGWQGKLERCAKGDQRWGVFRARK